MSSHHEYWQSNISDKISEIEPLVIDFIISGRSPHEERSRKYEVIKGRLNNLSDFYSKNNRPREIINLLTALQSFKGPAPENYLASVHAALDKLRSLKYAEPDNLIIFSELFNHFKSERQLDHLADELIEALTKLIDENEHEINSRLEKDLKRLLAQIKKSKNGSIAEISAIAEITTKFLANLYFQKKFGISGGSILAELVIATAKKLQKEAFLAFTDSEREFVARIDFKDVGRDYDILPKTEELDKIPNHENKQIF